MCDTILINVNAITMDPAQPLASLVAIEEDRIAAVSGNAMLDRLRGPQTQIIDCAGKTLIPGFIDAHCHIHAFAENLISLNLAPSERIHSIADIQDRVGDFCKMQPLGSWVRGKGYNEFYLAEGRHPDRHDLDVVAPLHPVKLTHRSGHAHVLNSLALKQAGITAETGDPPEGFIDRELTTGEPSGILYGMGEYLSGKIPFVEDADIDRGIAQANEKLLAYGITSVQDASSANDRNRWKRYESWKGSGLFQPRLTAMVGLKEFVETKLESLSSSIARVDFRSGGVKIILGQVSGTLHPSREELNENVAAIHASGLQAVIHAIEEPEIEAACDAIAGVLRRHPRPDHRHRIEHCSVCPPHLLRRIADLGITVVTQPAFIYSSGDRYLKTVSRDQRAHLYAIGSMIGCGLPVGFSSDCPISDPNPIAGIQAAVTRMTEEGNVLLPRERVSVSDALLAYTQGAAAANFEDDIKGSITRGKLADLVMLSDDPRTVNPAGIKDIRTVMTMLGGRMVWSEAAFPLQMKKKQRQ